MSMVVALPAMVRRALKSETDLSWKTKTSVVLEKVFILREKHVIAVDLQTWYGWVGVEEVNSSRLLP
jgi:hypothetical protein